MNIATTIVSLVLGVCVVVASILNFKAHRRVGQIAGEKTRGPIDKSSQLSDVAMSDVKFQYYDDMRNRYNALTWSQKIALKEVCERTGSSQHELSLRLSALGFGEAQQKIVTPLLNSGLVDLNHAAQLEIKHGEVDYVWKLIKEKPLC